MNKNCLYCNAKINKFFGKFCDYNCREKYYEKEYKNEKIARRKKLKNKYIIKEEETSDIKIKTISLEESYLGNPYGGKREDILKLVNEWKNIQGNKLNILNINVYKVCSRWIEECEPWQAHITYNFFVNAE